MGIGGLNCFLCLCFVLFLCSCVCDYDVGMVKLNREILFPCLYVHKRNKITNVQWSNSICDYRQLMKRMGEIGFGRAEGFVDSRSDLEDQFTVGNTCDMCTNYNSIYVYVYVDDHFLVINHDSPSSCFQSMIRTHTLPIFYNLFDWDY